MAAGSLDDARRELYALPPEQFVPRRAELARAARTAGDRPGAQAVMALRKPSKSASLLNRLAAARPDKIVELLDLGIDFHRAQGDPDPDRLYELTVRRRRLVAGLAGLATTASGEPAPTPAVHEEMVGTLNAAMADEGAGARLARGELIAAIEWSGLGSGFGGLDGTAGGPVLRLLPGGRAPRATATTERADPARSAAADTAAAEEARAEQKAAQQEAAEQEAARWDATKQRARAAERTAQSQLDRLEASVKKLTAQLDRETARLEDARSAVGRARTEYDSVSASPPPAGPARGPARSEP